MVSSLRDDVKKEDTGGDVTRPVSSINSFITVSGGGSVFPYYSALFSYMTLIMLTIFFFWKGNYNYNKLDFLIIIQNCHEKI